MLNEKQHSSDLRIPARSRALRIAEMDGRSNEAYYAVPSPPPPPPPFPIEGAPPSFRLRSAIVPPLFHLRAAFVPPWAVTKSTLLHRLSLPVILDSIV